MRRNLSTISRLIISLVILFVLSSNLFATNIKISTVAPVPGGTIVDTLIVELGGYATLAGNITVNSLVHIKTGGILRFDSYKVLGAASVTLQTNGVISYSQRLIDSALAVSGTKTLGTTGIFVLTGTDRQDLSGSFPAVMNALIIYNIDSVYKNGQIEVIDSVSILAGTLNLNGNRLVSNNNLLIRNNSALPHNFNLRMENSTKTYTIVGNAPLKIANIDTQNNDNQILLKNDMRIQSASRPRMEKGSWINLNGYNFTIGPNFDVFNGYGTPCFFDISKGGSVIFEVNSNMTKTIYFKIATGNSQAFVLKTNSGTYNANASISVRYSKIATADSASTADYLSSYIDLTVTNITNPNYKVDYYYDNGDIVGNEGKMGAESYVGGLWYENVRKAFIVASTNNIIYDSLTASCIVTARTGSTGNLPNLYINIGNSSEASPYNLPDGTTYDSIIIENRGVALLSANLNIANLFLLTGGKLKCSTFAASGVNFMNEANSYLCIGSTQGLDKSKGTTGNIRFLASNYNGDAYYWYNGTVAQSLGVIFSANWANLYNLIIDNPTQVNSSATMTLSRTLDLRKGKFNGNNQIIISGPNAKIINNAGYKSLTSHTINSNNVNDGKMVEISGDTITYIKGFGFDEAIEIHLKQDITVETVGDGYNRAILYLDNRTVMFLATAVSTDSVIDFGRIYVSDKGVIKQQLTSTLMGKNLNYRTFTSAGTSIPMTFKYVSGTLGASPWVMLSVIAKKNSMLPDTLNCIKRYLTVDTMGISDINYNAMITYITGDIIGSIVLMEGGFYDGASWIEPGVVLNTIAKRIRATNMTAVGALTAGELHSTSVGEIRAETSNVWPNPTTGLLNIKGKEVVVSDVLGKMILNTKSSNGSVDLSNCPKGMYFVNVDGKTEKILVK